MKYVTMNEILELQTNQVSFISGLMAGFSLTIAAQILRSNNKGIFGSITFLMFTLSSLLFVVALYIDVRLSIEVAAISEFSTNLLDKISNVRRIGTTSASAALFLFITSIAMLTWLKDKTAGIIGTIMTLVCLLMIIIAKYKMDSISLLLQS